MAKSKAEIAATNETNTIDNTGIRPTPMARYLERAGFLKGVRWIIAMAKDMQYPVSDDEGIETFMVVDIEDLENLLSKK